MGWQVFDSENSEQASKLLKSICKEENVNQKGLILHSDNGAPMKGLTMCAMMNTLGVILHLVDLELVMTIHILNLYLEL